MDVGDIVTEALQNERALLFTGMEVGFNDVDDDGRRLEMTFDVERVFAGPDVGASITLINQVDTCGGRSAAFLGRAVFRAYQNEGTGDYRYAACGNGFSVTEVEALIDGLPDPRGSGRAEFVVSHSLADSRLATLDKRGRVLRYDTTFDRVPIALAACPGGKRFVVASTDSDWDPYAGEPADVQIATIRIRDFKATIEREINVEPTTDREGLLEELRCHDRRGKTVTYFLPGFKWDALWGGSEYNQGNIHLWKGTDLVDTDSGITRAVATNKRGTHAWTVNGVNGRRLSEWDLRTGERIETVRMEKDVSAWTIESLGEQRVAVIARVARIPNSRTNRGYRGAATLLSGRLNDLQQLDLPVQFDGKFPPAIISTQLEDDRLQAIYRNQVLSIDESGEVQIQPLRGEDRVTTHIAVGSLFTLADGTADSGVGILSSRNGRKRPIKDLTTGSIVVAIPHNS